MTLYGIFLAFTFDDLECVLSLRDKADHIVSESHLYFHFLTSWISCLGGHFSSSHWDTEILFQFENVLYIQSSCLTSNTHW